MRYIFLIFILFSKQGIGQTKFSIKLVNCDSSFIQSTDFTNNNWRETYKILPEKVGGDFLLNLEFLHLFADITIQKEFNDTSFVYKRFLIQQENSNNLSISCSMNGFEKSFGLIDFDDFLYLAYEFSNEENINYRNRSIPSDLSPISYDSLLKLKNEEDYLKFLVNKKQLQFIAMNAEKLESLILLDRMVERLKSIESKLYLETFEKLSVKLRHSYVGLQLRKDIELKMGRSFNFPTIGEKNKQHLNLYDTEGKLIDLNAFIGRKVLITFWATWCGPCVQELPFLKMIHEKYPDLVLIGLSEDEDILKLKQFLLAKKIDWSQIVITQETKYDFNVDAIPVSILIDEEGVIQNMRTGGMTFSDYEDFLFVK